MPSGVFQRSLSSDIEWHTLTFLRIRKVFQLQAVSASARDSVRRLLPSYPWDIVLRLRAKVALRCLEELYNANVNIRSLYWVRFI